LQHEISIVGNVTMKMYYEEFPLEVDHSPIKFKERMEKAMEQVKKDHYFTFYKHLPVCDPTLGTDFLRKSSL